MQHGSLVITLPDWVARSVDFNQRYVSDAEKMALVLELVKLNLQRGSGGPFGAAIYHGTRLVAVGLSSVKTMGTTLAHAPIVALGMAQAAERASLDSPRLVGNAHQRYEAFLNCECCSGCAYFLVTGGVQRVVFAAPGKLKAQLGMEQGEEPTAFLKRRGVEVAAGVLAAEARHSLLDFLESDGDNYNPVQ